MAISETYDQRGVERRWKRASRGRLLTLVVVFVSALVGLAVSPRPLSQAATNASDDAAQVRVFENGSYLGGGTLVDRNWVLTTASHFSRPDNPSIYSIRYGVVNAEGDDDDSNLRSVDRIVAAPRGDVALAHFADPVPRNIAIPHLATAAPRRGAQILLYEWIDNTLKRALTVVYDPVAKENADAMRSAHPVFTAFFPENIQPMATIADTDLTTLDRGSGVFSGEELVGVGDVTAEYHRVNGSGNLGPRAYTARYEQPVWQYRDWIQRVISGEGSSNPPPHDELRRRLPETDGGGPAMTPPPSTNICDAGDEKCASPDPVWKLATLEERGSAEGYSVRLMCADVTGNECSFGGTVFGYSTSLSLPSSREVMVWCKTTAALIVGGSPEPALRVSLTNAERSEVPAGQGWWHVNPAQVTTGKAPVDTAPFATC